MIFQRDRHAWQWLLLQTAVTGLALCLVTACARHYVAPWELAPLGPGRVESVRLANGPEFQVDRIRFFSEELGAPRFFLVLTPAGDPRPEQVLILNHGWADRPEDLITSLGVDTAYAALLKEGGDARARLVLPDVRFSEAERRKEANDPFKKYLVLVGEEIPDLLSRTYGIPFERTRWGIGGFSFGGHVALDVARRYPGRFGSASVVSSFYEKDWTFWPSGPPPPGALDGRGRGKQSIVLPGPVPRLMLACGTGDRFIAGMRSLHDRLTGLGISHDWSTAPGDHTWAYWKSVLRPMLTFHLPVRPRSAEHGSGPRRPSEYSVDGLLARHMLNAEGVSFPKEGHRSIERSPCDEANFQRTRGFRGVSGAIPLTILAGNGPMAPCSAFNMCDQERVHWLLGHAPGGAAGAGTRATGPEGGTP